MSHVNKCATTLRLRLADGESIEEVQPDLQPLVTQLTNLLGSDNALFGARLTQEFLEGIQCLFDRQSASGTCTDHALCYMLRTLLMQL